MSIDGFASQYHSGVGDFDSKAERLLAEKVIIDGTDTDTFVIRKNQNGDEVFTVDTTNSEVKITGDMTVVGNASFTSTDNFAVADNLISMASANTGGDLLDIGFYGTYNDGTTKYAGLFRDQSDSGIWKLIQGITVEPGAGSNFPADVSGNKAALLCGDITGVNITSTAQILGASGDATTPGLSFSADPNTGIYNSTNLIGFTTDGTSRMTINSSGNVLVSNDLFTENGKAIYGHDGTGYRNIATYAGTALYLGTSTNVTYLQGSAIALTNASGNAVVIDSSSNISTVGDITIAPTDVAKNPYLKVRAKAEDKQSILQTLNLAGSVYLDMRTYGSTHAGSLLGHNVAGKNMLVSVGGDLVVGGYTSQALYLASNGATAVTIDTGGKVGIGTTTGTIFSKAEIRDSDNQSMMTTLTLTNNGAYAGAIGSGFGPAISFVNSEQATGGQNRPMGRIGAIVTNAAGTGSNRGALIFETRTNGDGTVTEKMRIDYNGNVGVGTDTPIGKLDVHGGNDLGVDINIVTDSYTNNPATETDIAFLRLGWDYRDGAGLKNCEIVARKRLAQYMPSMDFRTLATYGTPVSRMMITESGTIGIGTDDPQNLLHIYNSDATADVAKTALVVSCADAAVGTGDEGPAIEFQINNSSLWRNCAKIYSNSDSGSATAHGLVFETCPDAAAGTYFERLRISSSGRVVIGLNGGAGDTCRLDLGANGIWLDPHANNGSNRILRMGWDNGNSRTIIETSNTTTPMYIRGHADNTMSDFNVKATTATFSGTVSDSSGQLIGQSTGTHNTIFESTNATADSASVGLAWTKSGNVVHIYLPLISLTFDSGGGAENIFNTTALPSGIRPTTSKNATCLQVRDNATDTIGIAYLTSAGLFIISKADGGFNRDGTSKTVFACTITYTLD